MSSVNDRVIIYLTKAIEGIAGAQSEFVNGRYNNCANRCYYACFHAAAAALFAAGLVPQGPRPLWSHETLPALFVGELINRRKRYPAALRPTLERTASLREAADYQQDFVSQTQAQRALRAAGSFVQTIQAGGGEHR